MCYSQGKKKKAELKALDGPRGKEKVSGTLAIKGFQTIHGISQKHNSKENVSNYSDLPVGLEACNSVRSSHWQNEQPESQLQATRVI